MTVPAAVVSPVFFKGADRKRARIVLQAALFAALVAGVAYGLAAADLGISTIGGFREWLLESRHGTENRGVARMVFGLGRSFVSMGDYGMLFKRFLLHDPYNPVSLGALLRSSLWALALFHLVLVSIAVRLLRSADQRRILALAALGSLPLLAFAAHFDGGAIERYLPLYPFVFLALASSLQSRPLSLSGAATVALVAVASMANASGMRSTTLAREQEEAAARMRAVVMRARPMSRVFAVNWQDDLVNFRRSFPLHDLNRRADLRITSLVTPGTAQAAGWRSEFARLALETWQEGGDVWISTRALSPRPRAEWNWVEGGDPHLTWPEFPRFFSALEMGERAGGEDGFLRLPPTPGNEHALRAEAR